MIQERQNIILPKDLATAVHRMGTRHKEIDEARSERGLPPFSREREAIFYIDQAFHTLDFKPRPDTSAPDCALYALRAINSSASKRTRDQAAHAFVAAELAWQNPDWLSTQEAPPFMFLDNLRTHIDLGCPRIKQTKRQEAMKGVQLQVGKELLRQAANALNKHVEPLLASGSYSTEDLGRSLAITQMGAKRTITVDTAVEFWSLTYSRDEGFVDEGSMRFVRKDKLTDAQYGTFMNHDAVPWLVHREFFKLLQTIPGVREEHPDFRTDRERAADDIWYYMTSLMNDHETAFFEEKQFLRREALTDLDEGISDSYLVWFRKTGEKKTIAFHLVSNLENLPSNPSLSQASLEASDNYPKVLTIIDTPNGRTRIHVMPAHERARTFDIDITKLDSTQERDLFLIRDILFTAHHMVFERR